MFKIKHPFCDKYLSFKYDSRYYANSRRVWYFNDERTWSSVEAKDLDEAVKLGSEAVSETKKLISELYDSGDDWTEEISRLKHLKQMLLKAKIIEYE